VAHAQCIPTHRYGHRNEHTGTLTHTDTHQHDCEYKHQYKSTQSTNTKACSAGYLAFCYCARLQCSMLHPLAATSLSSVVDLASCCHVSAAWPCNSILLTCAQKAQFCHLLICSMLGHWGRSMGGISKRCFASGGRQNNHIFEPRHPACFCILSNHGFLIVALIPLLGVSQNFHRVCFFGQMCRLFRHCRRSKSSPFCTSLTGSAYHVTCAGMDPSSQLWSRLS